MKVFHVSDVHFGPRPEKDQAARKLLTDLWVQFDTATDHLIVTGDITANGDAVEYAHAVERLENFRGHLSLLPGNHDYCNGGNVFEKKRAQLFETHLLQPLGIQHSFLHKAPEIRVLRSGAIKVLLVNLNSNRMNQGLGSASSGQYLANGLLGSDQLGALDEVLRDPAHQDCWRVVSLHHQPKRGGDLCDWLADADDLLAIVRDRVQVLAFGHTCGGPLPQNPYPDPGDLAYTPPKHGRPALLNANQSVLWGKYFTITFDKPYQAGAFPPVSPHTFS